MKEPKARQDRRCLTALLTPRVAMLPLFISVFHSTRYCCSSLYFDVVLVLSSVIAPASKADFLINKTDPKRFNQRDTIKASLRTHGRTSNFQVDDHFTAEESRQNRRVALAGKLPCCTMKFSQLKAISSIKEN